MPLWAILLLALLPAAIFSVWVSWATYKECEFWDWPAAHHGRQQGRIMHWFQRMGIG